MLLLFKLLGIFYGFFSVGFEPCLEYRYYTHYDGVANTEQHNARYHKGSAHSRGKQETGVKTKYTY